MPLRNSRLEFQAKPSQGVGDCKSNYKDPYPIFDQNRRKWRAAILGVCVTEALVTSQAVGTDSQPNRPTSVSVSMNWKSELLIVFLAGAPSLATHAVVDSAKNPFQSIVKRNAFRLEPIPPVAKPRPALPSIRLVGITTILGDKRAILRVQLPANYGETIKEQSLILIEVHSDSAITVMEIDEIAGTVRLNNSGTMMLLSLEPVARTVSVRALFVR